MHSREIMLETEYGSSEPVGFWQPTLHDSAGNVVEIPSCPKCSCLMQMVIGKEAFAWICTEC